MTTIKELISLKGRRAIITGATGALGRVMSDTLAELGASLLLVDRPGSNFDALNESLIERWGAEIQFMSCDLEHAKERSYLVEKLKNDGKSINILINNAAFIGASELQGWSVPFEEQSIESWRRALEVNLTAIFDVCKGLTPILRASKGGSIINIASIYGQYAPDWSLYEGTDMSNPAAYAASKGGVLQLTRWLSTALAPKVRVNAISPGGILRGQPENFVRRYEAKTPLGRMANEDDFRGAIAYLSSDLSQYMTGQNLTIDGGWGV